MPAELEAQEPFGPYLVYERLGIGGMATVHRALERGIEGFERQVALKRLLPHLAEDASFIKSFVREAKLASLLNHVNIVQIFELGRVGTEYFISMEYIDGRDVRRILRHARSVTGPPPLHVTIGLLLQLCDALEYAHTKTDESGQPLGVVHRDVSPSNLLVTHAGYLKVIDFGIAKAQSAQLRTQTGRVKGKLAYMAPEALAGKELDARSDLFAVGVIAHELLTARPLFASKSDYQTLMKLERGDVAPPSTQNPECPPELDSIVLKALARDPDDRYANAAELREALNEIRRAHDLSTTARDIATWLQWAFSSSDPVGDQTTAHPKQRLPRPPTPRPLSEDEEAVAVAWGGSQAESSAVPVVLEDVPDVSGKFPAELEPDDDDDDIPTPVPSHGRADAAAALVATEPVLLERRASTVRPPTSRPTSRPPTSRPTSRPPTSRPHTSRPPTAHERPGTLRAPRTSSRQLAAGNSDAMTAVETTPSPRGPRPARVSTVPPTFAGGSDDLEALMASRRPMTLTSALDGAMPLAHLTAPPPRRGLFLAISAIAVVGMLGVVYLTRGEPASAARPAASEPGAPTGQSTGTLKFITQPADAEITIAGEPNHVGSPWSIALEPGIIQIQIQRKGYKTWLTSLELDASETQTLRVVLEPIDAAVLSTDATLILSSTPSGLEVVIDGKPIAATTPLKIGIQPGPHTVGLRRDGSEVWAQSIVAQPRANYELNPTIGDRVARAGDRPGRQKPSKLADKPAPAAPPPGALPPHPSKTAAATAPTTAPTPAFAPGASAASPTAARRPGENDLMPLPQLPSYPAAPSHPIAVPPNAVTKLSGRSPRIVKLRYDELPEYIKSKVCIDTTGAVTSATLVTKLDGRAADDVPAALKTWRYAPYIKNGVAIPVCFAVGFRIQ